MSFKFSILLFTLFVFVSAKRGILELDDISFDRIVDGNKAVLVAFLEHSWKDPENYDTVATELPDLIVAKVDGSASHNSDLKTRFSITDLSKPVFKFFPKGSKEPETYGGQANGADLIDFVRIQRNPKMKELKELASKFLSSNVNRADSVKKAESIVNSLEGNEKDYANFYLNSMKKIQEKGVDFVGTEKTRLQNLIENKGTTENKKHEFTKRLNVLNSFIEQVL